ncbi:MAG: SDR family NAD(P)-dependent oxidoreductase [Pseudomonadota bacterium]
MTQALITGGARGLGRAMVNDLLAKGMQVTVVDIDCSPLAGIRGVDAITCDLSQPGAIIAIKDRLTQPLDMVVHAAGISATGAFTDIPWSNQTAVWAVNFQAPVRLTQMLMANDRIATGARLVFVASLSSFVSYPGAASYAGSKDGLTSYARSLAKSKQARSKSWSVTAAFPGPLRTDHASRYAPDNSQASVDRRMDPATAATAILYDAERRARTSLPGGAAKIMAALGWIAPGLTKTIMRKVIFEKIDKVRT